MLFVAFALAHPSVVVEPRKQPVLQEREYDGASEGLQPHEEAYEGGVCQPRGEAVGGGAGGGRWGVGESRGAPFRLVESQSSGDQGGEHQPGGGGGHQQMVEMLETVEMVEKVEMVGRRGHRSWQRTPSGRRALSALL